MKSLILRALFGLFALTAFPASATTLLQADLPTLTRLSDLVVRGTVLRTEPRWSGDKRRIVTDVEIQVHEVMKGEPRRTLTIVNPGGVIGDIGQQVAGTPSFTEGEEVIVFLEQRGDRFLVSGMSQGKYTVERSSDGTAEFAIPASVSDAALLDPVTGATTKSDAQPMPVSTLKTKVKETLKLAPAVTPSPLRKTTP